MTLAAILWDYDGTLVDSSARNFAVVKETVSRLNLSRGTDNIPALQTLEGYKKAHYQTKNWVEMYQSHFGLTKEETKQAGALWSECQKSCKIAIKPFAGINKVLKALDYVPHGICSQNCSNNIRKLLLQHNLDNFFKSIIGYQELSLTQQKPNPEGLIRCLDDMKLALSNKSTIIYIGDHEQDTFFAKNAETEFSNRGQQIKIIAIAACYDGAQVAQWNIRPDYCAYSPSDIIGIVQQINRKLYQ